MNKKERLPWVTIFTQNGVSNARELSAKYGNSRAALRALELQGYSMHHSAIYDKMKSEQLDEAKSDIKVCFFTDTHIQPKLEMNHLEWIGKWIKDSKPDHVVHGGDIIDMESLCGHIERGSYDDKNRPLLKTDLEYMKKGIKIINKASGGYPVKVCLGNHDYRVYLKEKVMPEFAWLLRAHFEEALTENGWKFYPYKEKLDIGGVIFTHAPMNQASNPIGGETVTMRTAKNANQDMVFGHIHTYGYFKADKVCGGYTQAICGGTAIPAGYIADYCKGASKVQSHGVVELTIRNGRIYSHQFIQMDTLKERYK